MRPMWKGTVAFGLVSIPIHLYAATEGKSISFRQVHAADGGRVQYKRVCSIDGQEVSYGDIAKGYELDDGSMVVLTDKDLATVPVSSSQIIDVLEFLPLEAIDPISYDRSYYLEPQKVAIKPYVLLRDALAKSGRVALVKVTLRQRESLALLRVHADVLVLSTLLWPEEVRTPSFSFADDPPQIRDQELAMAGSLIESMAEDVFDPDAYHDGYQQALRELIDAKVAGRETTTPGSSTGGQAEVIDLMSALEASIGATQPADDNADAAGAAHAAKDVASAAARPSRAKTAPKATAKRGGGKSTSSAKSTSAGDGQAADAPASEAKSTSRAKRGTGKTAGTGKGTTRRSRSA